METAEEKGIRDICIFLARLYFQAWFHAPVAAEAPRQDLQFLQNLYANRHIDKDISSVALNKFCNHLWYLAPEAAALAFFDKNISTDTKKLMVQALKLNESSDESIKKVAILPKDVSQYMGQEID